MRANLAALCLAASRRGSLLRPIGSSYRRIYFAAWVFSGLLLGFVKDTKLPEDIPRGFGRTGRLQNNLGATRKGVPQPREQNGVRIGDRFL